MKKLFTQKKSGNHLFQFADAPMRWLIKPYAAFVLVLILSIMHVCAQAPTLKYTDGVQAYTPNYTIAPLTPTASGIASYGYSSSAQLYGSGINQPYGVAVDAAGNIYVADIYNNLVKKIDPVTGHAVVLGTGFNMPYDIILDASGNIYVADYGNNAVKKILAVGGATVTIGSGFNKPSGLAFDAAGNLYVADAGNNAVKKMNLSTGKIVSLGFGFKSPWGVAVDKAGNVYVTDAGNGMLKKIPIDGGPTVQVLSGYKNLHGIVIDPSGNIFFSNYYNIDEYSPATTYSTIAAYGGALLPFGIAFDAQGNLYSANPGSNAIYKFVYDFNGGTPIFRGGPFVAGLSGLSGIAIDHQDNILLAGDAAKKMPEGYENPVDPYYNYYNQKKFSAAGIAVDPAENLYGTDVLNNALDILTPSGYVSLGGSGYNQPEGVAVDNKGVIFVADTKNNLIQKFPINKRGVTTGSGFNQPYGIAVDSSDNVYVADTYNNAVKKIPSGTNTTVTIGSGFNLPRGVAVDNLNNVFVADAGNNAVKMIAAIGGSTVTLASGLAQPLGVAVDLEGDIFVADGGDLSVRKIKQTGGYYISPRLPRGLVFNQTTGIITGKPTVISPPTYYTITAYNASGYAKTYVLIAVSAAADLAKLRVSGYRLSPYFQPSVNKYTDTVAATIPSITVTPTAADPHATITVNGTALASGATSAAIPVGEGPNTITTVVTSADGLVTKIYTITVFKPYSNNANLSQMHPDAGTMSPVFSPNVTHYTDNVTYTNTSVTITPITQDTLATIKVNGVAVASGSSSAAIPLAEGSNTITTVVTAPDGVTTKTYILTVMRAGSPDANLSQMNPSAGRLNQPFTPTVTNYTDVVFYPTASLSITPAAQDPLATIKINGTPVASGSPSSPIALAVGNTIIHTVVTAPDGATTKTYTLTVNRRGPQGVADAALQPESVQIATRPQLADDGISVHQGLSPNGDGVNDYLTIENISNYPDNKLSIMNRNGQLIFEAKGYDNSTKVFDGHSNKNGKMQLPGTYFYQLAYTVNGITRYKTGFIMLKY